MYEDKAHIGRLVQEGRHREAVGGLWEELGELQIEFLKSHGLKPEQKLVDIGCGCLRGGVHFIAYLAAGNYFGVDSNPSLLEAGREVEAARLGLLDKLPVSNLLVSEAFEFEKFGVAFDVALAQSLFTHLPPQTIAVCLAQLKKVVRPGGKLYATFFEVPEDHPREGPMTHPHGVTTHAEKDPYHYSRGNFADLSRGTGWRVNYHGPWNHPRDQHMLIFELE